MVLMLLISFAFAQTGGEPPEQLNNVQTWCLKNAELKDQLVRKGGCKWYQQDNPYALPYNPANKRRYICKKYYLAKKSSPKGYEGKLICPDPFGGSTEAVFQCATCINSDNSSGVPDDECMDSMYATEQNYCLGDTGKMKFFHDIFELKKILPSGDDPSFDEQNPDLKTPPGTPEDPSPPIT